MNTNLNSSKAFARCSRTRQSSGEKGAVLAWVALTVIFILGFVAIGINYSRWAVTARQLQNAADAVALGAAKKLNGTKDGWSNAKRAALTVLQEQKVYGARGLKGDVTFDSSSGDSDPLETDPDFASTTAESGEVVVIVERGVYRTDDTSAAFISLEGSSEEGLATFHNVPRHLVANAIRVSLRINRIPTYFTSFLGFSNLINTSVSGVAIAHPDNEVCTAPLAIPACDLLLETRPGDGMPLYYTEQMEVDNQCGRELVFTSANPFDPYDENWKDWGLGMIRSASYPRLPYSGETLNDKAIPLTGVVGMPVSTAEKESEPSTDELEAMFDMENFCAPARIGYRFKPMQNGFGSGGMFELGVGDLETTLADFIENGEHSFGEFFGEHSSAYPASKVEYGERVLQWPRSKKTMGMMLLPETKEGDWMNPFCHNSKVTGAKVAEVNVALIAPSSADDNYCDFDSLFSDKVQETVAPLPSTDPIIVGFVKAYLVDFNIRELKESDSFVSKYGSPTIQLDPPEVYDKIMDEDVDKIEHYIEQHLEWKECLDSCIECEEIIESEVEGEEPELVPEDCDPECDLSHCDKPKKKDIDIPDDDELAESYDSYIDDCFNLRAAFKPYAENLKHCYEKAEDEDDDDDGDSVECTSAKNFHKVKDAAGGKITAVSNSGTFCLPRKAYGCYPASNHECWNDPEHMPVQYGCGGIRARLGCESGQVMFGLLPINQQYPRLMK